jgi:hypothetical protein
MPASSLPTCSREPASTLWRRDQARSGETNEPNLQEFLTSRYHQRPGRDAPLRVVLRLGHALPKVQRAPFGGNLGFGRSRFPCHRLRGKLGGAIQLRRMADMFEGWNAEDRLPPPSPVSPRSWSQSKCARRGAGHHRRLRSPSNGSAPPIASAATARAASLVFDATWTPDAAARGTESEASCSV